MNRSSNQVPRRNFLKHVGSGMLVAGLGPALASDLGFSSEFATRWDNELTFGPFDKLVDMMQQLPPEKLQINLVRLLNSGDTDLRSMTAAAALANAETFGGQDYVGYHAEMALVPALEMASRLPTSRAALPVLKVLFRNTDQIQKTRSQDKKTLRPLEVEQRKIAGLDRKLRDASRQGKMDEAEQLFASVVDVPPEQQLHAMLETIEDDINVHRFVLAHRAMELIDVVGADHAHTMLRQCVRYCVDEEQRRLAKGRPESPIRRVLPKLLDQYKLLTIKLGSRDPGDDWVEEMAGTIYEKNEFEASEAVAAALAEGISISAVADAISLAANSLILRQGADRWRTHGDSPGVHGTDAANAWRNMVQLADQRHKVSGLIVSAYHTGRYQPFQHDPYPVQEHLERVKTANAKQLLGLAEEAIRSNDQALAAAAIELYGRADSDRPRPVFDLMLKYAISEDGRLHSEKFYRTVEEEFEATRPAFKWRHLVGLARVTASAYGYDRNDQKGHRAPGYAEACQMLGVDV